MALIDYIEWKPQRADIFAHKFTEKNVSAMAQLVVGPSQEAVLIAKGQFTRKFGPGKHQLSTENVPVARKFFGIPFGGNNPFTDEIWFTNTSCRTNLQWSTTAVRYMDPSFQSQIPLSAGGNIGFTIKESEKFIQKLVGEKIDFFASDMNSQCQGCIYAKLKSLLIGFMQANGLSVTNVTASLDDITRCIRPQLEQYWETFGVSITDFNVGSVDVDDSSEEGRSIRKALTDRTVMNLTGHTWQQEKAFDTVNNVMGNGGEIGNMGALAMAMGMMNGGGIGGSLGAGMIQPTDTRYMATVGNGQSMGQTGQFAAVPNVPRVGGKDVFCDKCGKRFSSMSKFCPHCGDSYNPCPMCGADNDQLARRCVRCGNSLMNTVQMQAISSQCERCGAELPSNVKFCPSCGKRVGG